LLQRGECAGVLLELDHIIHTLRDAVPQVVRIFIVIQKLHNAPAPLAAKPVFT
jgi:hypothetical protein